MHTLLMTTDVAERLRVSPRTIERFRTEGTGPRFCKLGRRVVYREADLAEWISAQARQSTSEVRQ